MYVLKIKWDLKKYYQELFQYINSQASTVHQNLNVLHDSTASISICVNNNNNSSCQFYVPLIYKSDQAPRSKALMILDKHHTSVSKNAQNKMSRCVLNTHVQHWIMCLQVTLENVNGLDTIDSYTESLSRLKSEILCGDWYGVCSKGKGWPLEVFYAYNAIVVTTGRAEPCHTEPWKTAAGFLSVDTM